jgi:hypothetical protein
MRRLGRRALRAAAGSGGRAGAPARGADRRQRLRRGDRSEGDDVCHPDRVRDRDRSGQGRADREPRAAWRERHRRDPPDLGARRQTDRARARVGSGGEIDGGDRQPRRPDAKPFMRDLRHGTVRKTKSTKRLELPSNVGPARSLLVEMRISIAGARNSSRWPRAIDFPRISIAGRSRWLAA